MKTIFNIKTTAPEPMNVINIIVAPEDLTDDKGKKIPLTYNDAVKRISELKNWHGFDGESFANDKEILKAIEDESYKGGWFIPPRELLQQMYLNKDKTYTTASGSDFALWYWSSTEHRDFPDFVWFVRFSDGFDDWFLKDFSRLSCRPCRAELNH